MKWNENKVRIKDIAEELGLSTATVSNVLHGKTQKISDSTVKAVEQKLEERGYQGWYCMEYCWTPNWEDCARNDNISEILLTKKVIEEA